MTIQIATRLVYDFAHATDILLQVEAASTPEQTVRDTRLDISAYEDFARIGAVDAIGERLWMRVEGRFAVEYRASVDVDRRIGDIAAMQPVPFHRLPGETVQYLMASRYCPSDLFEHFVTAEFDHLFGGAKIAAIRDWIEECFTYDPLASSSATTALESFVQRKGVCRDYAHVLITLARASGIPARVASVYALGVDPMDFHAVAEVYLDDAWHLVDATGMARPETMVKIGVGRDAADVAFLTSYGLAEFREQSVVVTGS